MPILCQLRPKEKSRVQVAPCTEAVLLTDRRGVLLACDDSGEDLLECARSELVGQNIQSILKISLLNENGIFQNADPDREFVCTRKDRTQFVLSLSTTETEIHGQKILVHLARDLTNKKEAFASSEYEARLRSILDTSLDAIVVFDETDIIEMFSPAASRLFGYTSAEAVGSDAKMLIPPSHRHDPEASFSRYQSKGEIAASGKWRIAVGQRSNGVTFPMEISVGEVLGGDKRQFTAFMHDVSERHHDLHELQGEFLHASRLSVMGQMTAAIAHELNQPLTAITNYVGGASRTLAALHDAQGEIVLALEMMEKAAEQTLRAGAIVKSLGDFVKKRTSNRTLENLNKVVEEAIALGFVGAADSNVKLRLHLEASLPFALIDRVQIQQVIINLIRNGIEAMEAMKPNKKRELTVTTCFEQPHFVTMTVSDTGPGLSNDVAKSLFQPLITTKDRGMGIGLAICRSILDAHGGDIWVLPEMSHGTTFCLRLPLPENAGPAS